MTMLKLEWLGERIRKIEKIKKQVSAGTYHVDSRLVVRAMFDLNDPLTDPKKEE